MFQGTLNIAQDGDKSCNFPHGASSVEIQDARNRVSWRLSPISQWKAWEARQYVAGLESLWAASERAMHGTVRLKPKLQWKSQELKDARNMNHVLRKALGNKLLLAK